MRQNQNEIHKFFLNVNLSTRKLTQTQPYQHNRQTTTQQTLKKIFYFAPRRNNQNKMNYTINFSSINPLTSCDVQQIYENCKQQLNNRFIIAFILNLILTFIITILFLKKNNKFLKDLLYFRLFIDFILLTTYIFIII